MTILATESDDTRRGVAKGGGPHSTGAVPTKMQILRFLKSRRACQSDLKLHKRRARLLNPPVKAPFSSIFGPWPKNRPRSSRTKRRAQRQEALRNLKKAIEVPIGKLRFRLRSFRFRLGSFRVRLGSLRVRLASSDSGWEASASAWGAWAERRETPAEGRGADRAALARRERVYLPDSWILRNKSGHLGSFGNRQTSPFACAMHQDLPPLRLNPTSRPPKSRFSPQIHPLPPSIPLSRLQNPNLQTHGNRPPFESLFPTIQFRARPLLPAR